MIFEQALFSLPEILRGRAFFTQDYESGLVGAFSLAIMQQLNSRNIANPIQCLKLEQLYRELGKFENSIGQDERIARLRCDIYLNLMPLRLGTVNLRNYGFKFGNYLECKFYRRSNKKGSGNKTNQTALLFFDIFRLTVLVEDFVGKTGRSHTGRYLLHVYEGSYSDYITKKNTLFGNNLFKSGQQELSIDIRDLNKTEKNLIGDLTGFKAKLTVTNFIIMSSHRDDYSIYLTRIDSLLYSYGEIEVNTSQVNFEGPKRRVINQIEVAFKLIDKMYKSDNFALPFEDESARKNVLELDENLQKAVDDLEETA